MASATRAGVKEGDFIEVPAWRTFGLVISVDPAQHGSESAIRLVLQEHPDQRITACRAFTLEPGEFTIV